MSPSRTRPHLIFAQTLFRTQELNEPFLRRFNLSNRIRITYGFLQLQPLTGAKEQVPPHSIERPSDVVRHRGVILPIFVPIPVVVSRCESILVASNRCESLRVGFTVGPCRSEAFAVVYRRSYR